MIFAINRIFDEYEDRFYELRNLTSLLEKELLLATPHRDGTTYTVYNVFLSRWFESQ